MSRSFGSKLDLLNDIESALIVYVQKACSKMRSQKLFCKTITIFLKTSKYQLKIHSNSKDYNFIEATNDTRVIWKISKKLLSKIYRKNFFTIRWVLFFQTYALIKKFNKVYCHIRRKLIRMRKKK